jgi:hypothetical protein
MAHRSDPGQGSGPPRYPGTFRVAFREALESMGWHARRWLGSAVECVDAGGEERVVGLENLYRRARRADRATWPELVRDFLERISSGEFDHPPDDLASVAEQLLVRVGPPIGQQVAGKSEELRVWFHPLVSGQLGASLVIDYPQSMAYVTEEMVAESGQPGEDWLQQAVANLIEKTPADCLRVLDEESGLRSCSVGDAYDSSRALVLDNLLPEAADDGFFAAIPSRDELLVMPVSAHSLTHVPLLKHLAEKQFQSAPYAITDEIYWIHHGRWYLFQVALSKDRVMVTPPPEFVEVLKRLAPEEMEGAEDPGEEQPEG